MNMNKKKGFTIVELVIVIAVIAILAAVMIPTFSNITKKANAVAALEKAKNASSALLAVNNGSMAEGTVFVVCDKNEAKWFFEFKNNSLKEVSEESEPKIENYLTNATGLYVSADVVKVQKNNDANATVTFDETKGGKNLMEAVFGAEKTITCKDKLGLECTVTNGEGENAKDYGFYYAPDIATDVVVLLPAATTGN